MGDQLTAAASSPRQGLRQDVCQDLRHSLRHSGSRCAAVLAMLPLLAACSSSPGGYPTLSDAMHGSHSASATTAPAVAANSSVPQQPVAQPAVNVAAAQHPGPYSPPLLGTSSAGTQLAGMSPPGFVAPTSPPVEMPPPPPPLSPAEQAKQDRAKEADEALASAYPSVSLTSLIREHNQPAPARKPAPIVSDMPASSAVASAAPAAGQPAPATPGNAAAPPAPPAPLSPAEQAERAKQAQAQEADDALASAYPSQSIFSAFRKSSN